MKNSLSQKKGNGKNVFFIGLISFFGGISQDIFLPLLPIYLSSVLGLPKSFIGFTEGVVTSSASLFKIAAGFLTDKLKKRKEIIFVGYFLSMIARPLLAIITSRPGVLVLRFLDGSGKGIKVSPKDALIADSTQKVNRGKGFGIARMLDTFGSVVGPLFLFGLLYVFKDNRLKYHYIFFISAIPLIFTLFLLVTKVRERVELLGKSQAQVATVKKKLPGIFFLFLGIVVLFNLGNSSDTFIILRAEDVGVSILTIPLVYALFNFVYASASVPLGSLSDKIGREKVILLGWLSYSLAYLGFALANKSIHIWLLFAFYGVYYATTEGVAKALIADLVDKDHRGKAYGIYNALIAMIALPAGLIAGYLWDMVNSSAPFFFGSFMSLLAIILLMFFIQYKKRVTPITGI